MHLGHPTPVAPHAVTVERPPQLNPKLMKRLAHCAEYNALELGATMPRGSDPVIEDFPQNVADSFTRLDAVICFATLCVNLGPCGTMPTALYKRLVRGQRKHHLSSNVPVETGPETTHS